jgi:hypothetical protein
LSVVGLVVAVAAGEVVDRAETEAEQDVLAGVSGDAFVAVGDGGGPRVEFADAVAEVGQRDMDGALDVALGVVAA